MSKELVCTKEKLLKAERITEQVRDELTLTKEELKRCQDEGYKG